MYTLKGNNLWEIEVPENLSYWFIETVNNVKIYSKVPYIGALVQEWKINEQNT